jgi:general secretion pathway protein J
MSRAAVNRALPLQRSGAREGTGFTLVEVLIALVLLSLLMLALTNAVRGMGQTEERVDAHVAASDDYRLATGWLRDTLGVVSPRTYNNTVAGAPAQIPFFDGASDQLAWIGVLPARFDAGGRHYLRLAIESDALVLRYAPWTGAATFSDWDAAPSLTLAAPASGLALRYQDPATGDWSTAWPPPGLPPQTSPDLLLPSAVRIDVDGAQPPWPMLVVAVRAAQQCRRWTGDFGGSSGGGQSC